MARDRLAIIEYLKAWAIEAVNDCKLKTVYLFGSILQLDGELFDLTVSDLDLLALFAGSDPHPLQKAEACRSLVPHIQRLERFLKEEWLHDRVRQSPLISAGAVTSFEFERGINIGGDPKFISANTFLDLVTRQPYHQRPGQAYVHLGKDVEQLLQKCQECRKEFLWVTADGHRKLLDLRDADEFLKKLGRSVAIFFDHVKPTTYRYDVPSGLAHIVSFLHEVSDIAECGAIERKLSARVYGRSVALTSFDQVLLWEIVASHAMGQASNWELQTRTAQMAPKEADTHHQLSSRPPYSHGSASAESIRLVGSAEEFFPREVVHISWAKRNYSFPHEIVSDYNSRLGRIEAMTHANNYPFYDGQCVRLLRLRWTPIDASEQKHIYMDWGPVSWYDYCVISDFVRECRKAGDTNTLAALADLKDIEAGHLERTRLPNTFVTAITLVTTDGFVSYAKRGSVYPNPGLWSCSVSENIHPQKDASTTHPDVPDPYRTVVRGIEEELSPKISGLVTPEDVVFTGVAFDLDELNPKMLFLVRLPLSLEEILVKCKDTPGKDFMEGVQHWLSGDAEAREWPPILSDTSWDAGGKASLIRALEFLRYDAKTG